MKRTSFLLISASLLFMGSYNTLLAQEDTNVAQGEPTYDTVLIEDMTTGERKQLVISSDGDTAEYAVEAEAPAPAPAAAASHRPRTRAVAGGTSRIARVSAGLPSRAATCRPTIRCR